MKRGILLAIPLVALMLAAPPPVEAQDFAKGLTAYESGDYTNALAEWKPLAYEGNADAQARVGFMYYKGQGVKRDHKAAVNFYKLSAVKGHAPGQAYLGFMYDFGRGVKKNPKLAVRWYRSAAEQGNAFGQLSLGKMYAKGESVLRDDILAYMWSDLAATQGAEAGAKNRDLLARKLTPDERAIAQRLARACLASNYKNCGG